MVQMSYCEFILTFLLLMSETIDKLNSKVKEHCFRGILMNDSQAVALGLTFPGVICLISKILYLLLTQFILFGFLDVFYLFCFHMLLLISL